MIRILLILPLAISVAACPQLDKLAKPDEPSAFQQHVQRTAAITAPYTEPTAVVVPAVARIAAVPVVAAPTCADEFRVQRCVNGVAAPWTYEPEPPPQLIEVAEVEPVVVPPPMVECVADEFRVSRCVEGKVMPW